MGRDRASRQAATLASSLLVAGSLLFALDASAVKYMSLGQAIKSYIPATAKIVKITKRLSSEQKRKLREDYGWEPTEDKYTFYVGKEEQTAVAYVFVVPEIFNTCFHKYAVGMKPTGEVIETVIIELSCPRSFTINRKGFLSQFKTKNHSHALTIKADIDAVTGATLSSEATATATRKAVSLHNLLFGGARAVEVAESVRKARRDANALIQKAIETGETLAREGGSGAAQLPESD